MDGILLCTKGSAPLTGITSRASAGALEMCENLFITNKILKFLKRSRNSGWQVLGATFSACRGKKIPFGSLQVQPSPTILVIGNEGDFGKGSGRVVMGVNREWH